jgi:hypothetical protein
MMIFDMVIEEGIVRLDQCDHNTFPYDHVSLSSGQDRYRFYGSYRQLRLVCRSFNALLAIRPPCDLDASTFPFSTSVRALHIRGSHEPVFRQLLVDTMRCERLVFLELACRLSTDLNRPNLSDILSAGEGGAFPNVQRLTLSVGGVTYSHPQLTFWSRLHCGFARLVTLSVEVVGGAWYPVEAEDKVVTFERLEILYIDGVPINSECHFPRLRHTSIKKSWNQDNLKILRRSPHLESLIAPYFVVTGVDVRSFSRLYVLSLHESQVYNVVPLDCDHPLEHLWIHLADISGNPALIDEVVERIPRIVRITMDLTVVAPERRRQRIQEFKGMRLDSFGLALRPIMVDDSLLVVE